MQGFVKEIYGLMCGHNIKKDIMVYVGDTHVAPYAFVAKGSAYLTDLRCYIPVGEMSDRGMGKCRECGYVELLKCGEGICLWCAERL